MCEHTDIYQFIYCSIWRYMQSSYKCRSNIYSIVITMRLSQLHHHSFQLLAQSISCSKIIRGTVIIRDVNQRAVNLLWVAKKPCTNINVKMCSQETIRIRTSSSPCIKPATWRFPKWWYPKSYTAFNISNDRM